MTITIKANTCHTLRLKLKGGITTQRTCTPPAGIDRGQVSDEFLVHSAGDRVQGRHQVYCQEARFVNRLHKVMIRYALLFVFLAFLRIEASEISDSFAVRQMSFQLKGPHAMDARHTYYTSLPAFRDALRNASEAYSDVAWSVSAEGRDGFMIDRRWAWIHMTASHPELNRYYLKAAELEGAADSENALENGKNILRAFGPFYHCLRFTDAFGLDGHLQNEDRLKFSVLSDLLLFAEWIYVKAVKEGEEPFNKDVFFRHFKSVRMPHVFRLIDELFDHIAPTSLDKADVIKELVDLYRAGEMLPGMEVSMADFMLINEVDASAYEHFRPVMDDLPVPARKPLWQEVAIMENDFIRQSLYRSMREFGEYTLFNLGGDNASRSLDYFHAFSLSDYENAIHAEFLEAMEGRSMLLRSHFIKGKWPIGWSPDMAETVPHGTGSETVAKLRSLAQAPGDVAMIDEMAAKVDAALRHARFLEYYAVAAEEGERIPSLYHEYLLREANWLDVSARSLEQHEILLPIAKNLGATAQWYMDVFEEL